MDQDAFRALLSTSNPTRSTQASRGNGRLVLGGGSTVKSTNSSNGSGSAYKPASSSTSLKPRKSKPKDSVDGDDAKADRSSHSAYRDRASERRQGKDGDFAEAEHLLENFQARVAAAESQVDKDVLEQQTKYLGGDERHTILVKGLDHALLERRKAELSEGGGLGQATDDDLELAYEQTAKPDPSEHLAPPSTTSKTIKRKHRDELLEQLKTSRTPADLVVVEKLKAAGKFKPIGFTSVDDKKQDEERKERKRRKAEKKKQRALKAEQAVNPTPPASTLDPAPERPQQPSQPIIQDKSITVEKAEAHPQKSSILTMTNSSIEPSNHAASIAISAKANTEHKDHVQKNEPVQDDDFDIFGEAGEYKGLDDESSEDEQDRDRKVKEFVPSGTGLGSPSNKKRKTYFEDDEIESDSNRSEPSKPVEEITKTHETKRKTMAVEEAEDDSETNEQMTGEVQLSDQVPVRLTKLEGLSGSTDIKSILAADAFQEKEEKRKAKKFKNKSEGPDHEKKVLSDKDRLNRDVLEMENFLKRKKTSNDPSTSSTPKS
ncbi:hypothetical protein H4Q26_007198 [Puccinia striiformis f. sp. tritici PST-130]|nr:hypothetical protein Pst134EB_010426 [Puccinia striiformis f. sp. tritici]KAI9609250.1 hypothetical protein H4Q26_007198 [Puccinia striiformis f. sp. tritici PST-130]